MSQLKNISPMASQAILSSSYSGLTSVFFAVYKEYYYLALSGFICVMTSINFWRNPILGLRRNMDFLMAFINFGLVVYYSNSWLHVYNLAIAVVSFNIACLLWHIEYPYWFVFHVTFHYMANISNILLYIN